jgi:hypothetical protein
MGLIRGGMRLKRIAFIKNLNMSTGIYGIRGLWCGLFIVCPFWFVIGALRIVISPCQPLNQSHP